MVYLLLTGVPHHNLTHDGIVPTFDGSITSYPATRWYCTYFWREYHTTSWHTMVLYLLLTGVSHHILTHDGIVPTFDGSTTPHPDTRWYCTYFWQEYHTTSCHIGHRFLYTHSCYIRQWTSRSPGAGCCWSNTRTDTLKIYTSPSVSGL